MKQGRRKGKASEQEAEEERQRERQAERERERERERQRERGREREAERERQRERGIERERERDRHLTTGACVGGWMESITADSLRVGVREPSALWEFGLLKQNRRWRRRNDSTEEHTQGQVTLDQRDYVNNAERAHLNPHATV